MSKERFKGFLAGLFVALVIAGAVPAFAQSIDVAMGGIRVYWDGVEKTLLDGLGNKVEPMIYNGTTYVPLRAMANLLGKEVDWDQQSMSVYIGGKPVAATTPLDQFPKEKIDHESAKILTGTKAVFNLKDKEIQCSNLLEDSGVNNIYILDGQYSKLVGKAVIPYTHVGSTEENYITFYSVGNDGTETEIISYDLKQTQDPIDIEVNLRGIENLKIRWGGRSPYGVALYDVSLLG